MRTLLPALKCLAPALLAGGLLSVSTTRVLAGPPAPAAATPINASASASASASAADKEKDIPSYDLLDAARKGLVSVTAEGSGDGRMTLSVTNRTKKHSASSSPPA